MADMTPYKLIVDGQTFEGNSVEILISGVNRVKQFVISAYRSIINKSDEKYSRDFLSDYFKICKYLNKVTKQKDDPIFDILIQSAKEKDCISYLNTQNNDKLKSLTRQIKGKQEVDDILDMLIG